MIYLLLLQHADSFYTKRNFNNLIQFFLACSRSSTSMYRPTINYIYYYHILIVSFMHKAYL